MRASLFRTFVGAVACLSLAASAMPAEQGRSEKDAGKAGLRQSVALPAGSREMSVLLIETHVPAEARVGEEYRYEIRVTNTTRNLALEDVRIEPRASDGVEVVAINPKQENDNRRAAKAKPKKGQEQQKPSAEQSQKQQGKPQGQHVWKIPRLLPGQTKTAQVTAVGDNPGKTNMCLGVDYRTALCLTTTFVKPELAVTKKAPERASVCDTIRYHYSVTNTGSGATKEITLTDPLPEGMHTADGKQQVTFKVESLKPNESRQFDAEVMATQAGELGSRAEAKSADGLSARSNRPATKITEPRLAVEARGPNVVSVGETVTYQVTVKNEGNAVAEDTRLSVEVPKGFDVLGASQEIRQPQDGKPAEPGQAVRSVELGNLKPGDQKQFWIRTVGREPGKQLGYNFLASSDCDRQRKQREPQRAVVRTEVIAMPALLLTTVDTKDPVKKGDEVTYRITVVNQGSAPAKNVKVVATLPKEMKFRKVTGTTGGSEEGGKISLQPVEKLDPNDKAEWWVAAQASNAGQFRFRTEVSSDRIQQPGVSLEPTIVYDSQESSKATAKKPGDGETR